MATTIAITGTIRSGGLSMKHGTYENDGSETTNEIDPGMEQVGFMKLTRNASAVATTGGSVDEVIPVTVLPSGTSKVTTDIPSGEEGYWFVIGKP